MDIAQNGAPRQYGAKHQHRVKSISFSLTGRRLLEYVIHENLKTASSSLASASNIIQHGGLVQWSTHQEHSLSIIAAGTFDKLQPCS